MDKTKLGSTEVTLAPLRSLHDFLLVAERFQIPNIKDFDKWANRVVNNLLYYQTNYFFMAIVIFLIVGFIHPGKMLVGMIAMIAVLAIFTYLSTEGRVIHNFKKKNPASVVIVILLGGSFVTYTLGSLLIFLMGILLPFCAIFVHSSLRLRNLKNRVANKMEEVGLKRTPMGVLLEQLDDATCMNSWPWTNIKLKPSH